MKNYSFPLNKSKNMYIEIYEHIKNDIINGVLAKDEKLPSKRTLANNLNVSVNTVINAYDILLIEGYIYSEEKKGYFVSDFLGFDYKDKSLEKEEVIKKEVEYIYDFTTSKIDNTLFPKSIFNSITKDIIYNDESFYNRVPFKGSVELRRQIKNLLYEEKSISVSIDQIVIGSNAHSLINEVIELLDAKYIMVENPGYYKKESFSIDVCYNNMDNKGFSVTEFSRSYAKLGILTSFSQFPLGIKMPMDRKIEISSYLEKSNRYIIEDSFDSSFRNNGYQTTPLFNISNNVFFLESFSRTMFPGLCISYMVIPKKLVDKYDKLFSINPKSIPSLDQLILSKFIESGKYANYVNRLRTSFLNKKKQILNILNKTNFKIVPVENYSSILIELENIDIDKLKKEFENKKINIHFISDFMERKVEKNILIIGFSAIDYNLINEGLELIINAINSSFK